MIRIKNILLCAAVIAAGHVTAPNADAGPLLDWLRGRRSSCNCQQQQGYNYYGAQNAVPYSAQYAGTVAPNVNGLQPGQCMKTCQQTCSRTVVNYVPYTAYRTTWNRVPVTTYKPVTNTDPCTGCTVTCMRPCTTYTYQMQRVPYTTQRPVYRTETYKVPVTTITNDCATGACNTGCSTCGVPSNVGLAPAQGFAPAPTLANPVTSGTQFETPAFPTTVPADTAPTLQGSTSRLSVPTGTLSTTAQYSTSSQRPYVEQRPAITIPANLRPQRNASNSASASPVRRNWSYSPVRLASFEKSVDTDQIPVRSTSYKRAVEKKSIREINSIWNDVR
jgi:hypothetical protein